MVGNLDLYLDAQPVKNWRSLVEIRFTNAPHGEITSLGGLAGTFKRTSTQQIDPNAGSADATMWGGYTVIERAHVDWTQLPYLKVRVGNFFTPFGIWNVDHGTPTLIAVQLPGVIQLRQMPLRQTGVQIYGSTFKGDWELGYIATVSNGRQELSNFAFDDNRGFGGRVYANNEKGEATVKLGASFYTGRVTDEEIDVTGIDPVTYVRKSTFDYREVVGGLDASIDVGRTRLRAEAAISSISYAPGKHALAETASLTPQYKPDSIETTAYMVVAHTLPLRTGRDLRRERPHLRAADSPRRHAVLAVARHERSLHQGDHAEDAGDRELLPRERRAAGCVQEQRDDAVLSLGAGVLMRKRAIAVATAALLLTSVGRSSADPDDDIFVVVNKANPATSLVREDLRPIFQTTKSEWPDGTRAEPINLSDDSPVRQAFDVAVLGLDAESRRPLLGRPQDPWRRATAAQGLERLRRRSRSGGRKGGVAYVLHADVNPTVKVVAKIHNGKVVAP